MLLFENLGFQPVATVRKSRTPFHLNQDGRAVEVVLDRAFGLGNFAEIEAIAATDSDLPAAQAAVLGLAKELGLTEVEPRSYLRMLLQAREDKAEAARSNIGHGSASGREGPSQPG